MKEYNYYVGMESPKSNYINKVGTTPQCFTDYHPYIFPTTHTPQSPTCHTSLLYNFVSGLMSILVVEGSISEWVKCSCYCTSTYSTGSLDVLLDNGWL